MLPVTSAITAAPALAQGQNTKVAEIKTVLFQTGDTTVWDMSAIKVTIIREPRGTFIKAWLTTNPHRRYFSAAEAPASITLKSGNETLFTMSNIEWTVTCYRVDVFGAQMLTPQDLFERVDTVEIGPMKATAQACGN